MTVLSVLILAALLAFWLPERRSSGRAQHQRILNLLVARGQLLNRPWWFLVWLADQPETDRATAGYFFLGVFGADYLRGETDFLGEGLSGEQWLRAMVAICWRAATVGFTNDSLGLHRGFEATRLACLDVVNRGQVADGISVPHAILDTPFPPEQKLRYFIEDGAVLDYDPDSFLKR